MFLRIVFESCLIYYVYTSETILFVDLTERQNFLSYVTFVEWNRMNL